MSSCILMPSFKIRYIALVWMLICGSLVVTNSARGKETTAEWVLSYEGKSTNTFFWDKRTRGLIKNNVPVKMAEALLPALGGPPDPVHVVARRYVSVSACVPHNCMDKGFFWIDSQDDIALGAYVSENSLTLGSNRLLPGELPAAARESLVAWLSEIDVQPKAVQFVSRSGQVTDLMSAQFSPRQKYRPSPEGPSFDCKKAATEIETTICSNAVLAKQDLDLATLFNEIRRGSSTVAAQDELGSIQRSWIKSRDATCEKSLALAECIGDQYSRQHNRLKNWVPTH